MNTPSGWCLCISCTHFFPTFPSQPKSTRSTTLRAPASRASFAFSSQSPSAIPDIAFSCFFFQAFTLVASAPSSSRSRFLSTTEMASGFRAWVSPLQASSSASPSNSAAAFSSASKARLRSRASSAAPRVTAITRRMPLAMPDSSISWKKAAWPVLVRCVPPQNSMLSPFHLGSSGSASSSPTGAPTLITRTGSGYRSPNTRRSEGIWQACSNGETSAYTGSCSAIFSFTMASTRASCSGSSGPFQAKSNRSRSASTALPFWSQAPVRSSVTPPSSTSRSAKFSTCVMVWLGATRRRRP
mmetsp:Transcript_6462/g.10659  ORF Transcript_6462/g.10659 Transcript_6462/m.10659 type:complete len:299 (-) Transcript_6462:223-1119(-)